LFLRCFLYVIPSFDIKGIGAMVGNKYKHKCQKWNAFGVVICLLGQAAIIIKPINDLTKGIIVAVTPYNHSNFGRCNQI